MSYINIINEANKKAIAREAELGLFAKLSQIKANPQVKDLYKDYFTKACEYILTLKEFYDLRNGESYSSLTLEELKAWNDRLNGPLFPENYETSYANPEYAVKQFGDMGQIMGYIYHHISGRVVACSMGRFYTVTEAAEYLLNVYDIFAAGKESDEALRAFVKDDAKASVSFAKSVQIAQSVDPTFDTIRNIIKTADFSDCRYLYAFGKNITDNEIRTAKFINSLSDAEIQSMADTFTNGFLVGYAKLGVDIHKKTGVAYYHVIGFERMARCVIQNMEKEGLNVCCYYMDSSEPNRQYDYDYKDEMAFVLDEEYVELSIKAQKDAYEAVKAEANGFAGPLALEIFGRKDFDPVNKKESPSYTDEQNKLMVKLMNENAAIRIQYIFPEERSFSIISYPVPEISDKFEEIFAATVKVNTLDYKTYEDIQQKLIDALDQGDHVVVKGLGANKTNLTIKTYELTDPSKQSAFENCVADVNIPVGEVFTSPVLKGTNGILNVGKVYLGGMLVKDLIIELSDGMITKCTCSNFDDEEAVKKYLDDIIMFHHDTLPIGEFAIGTNTTAYKMGIDYDIQDKLDVLIAEKTGPHFAMGDTCYSRSEDIKVYNPDGKEIIARDNEVSLNRKTDASKAYFNCHTDITIPYNELDTIDVVKKDGSIIRLIDKGRFVLPGTEELNKPLIELYGE